MLDDTNNTESGYRLGIRPSLRRGGSRPALVRPDNRLAECAPPPVPCDARRAGRSPAPTEKNGDGAFRPIAPRPSTEFRMRCRCSSRSQCRVERAPWANAAFPLARAPHPGPLQHLPRKPGRGSRDCRSGYSERAYPVRFVMIPISRGSVTRASHMRIVSANS